MGEGGAKIVSAVPVGSQGKTKLAGGMKGMGRKVIRKTVKARPGREGRIGAPRAHNVNGKFDVGEKAVPKVRGEVGVGGGEGGDKVVLACPH